MRLYKAFIAFVVILFVTPVLLWLAIIIAALAALHGAHAGEWVDVQPWVQVGEPRVEYGVPPASEHGSRQPRSCPEGGCAAYGTERSLAPLNRSRTIESYSIIGDQGSPGRLPSGVQRHSWTVVR